MLVLDDSRILESSSDRKSHQAITWGDFRIPNGFLELVYISIVARLGGLFVRGVYRAMQAEKC